MRSMKLAMILGVAFVAATILGNMNKAEARPQFVKAFGEKYEGLADQVKEKKCGVCHPEKDKKVRNDYGAALGKALGDKNVKDAEKISEALDKAAEAKNEDGKTFGEIIKSGKLPGNK